MPNNIQYASIFQTELDKAFEQTAMTGWMESNASLAKYTGGAEIKIPKLTMDGLGSYDRHTGYPEGAVNLTYQTVTMTQDRARTFTLDAMDVDESNFVATAGTVMGEFQRTHVVPEVDAYRMATLAQKAGTNKSTYTPAAGTILGKLQDDIAAVQDRVGSDVPLYIHITNTAKAMLEKSSEISKRLDIADFARGELNTKVKSLDNHLLIPMPSGRMYSKIDIYDGRTPSDNAETNPTPNQIKGGYAKVADGLAINWIIVAANAPIAVCKTDTVRIFDPLTNQKANAWQMDYRKYHDIWVPDNKVNGLQVSLASA